MWIVRWTFVGLVILIIVGISLQNNTLVELAIFNFKWADVPLFLIIYLSFAAGMVVFLLVAVFKQMQQSIEIARCHREIKKLQKQLATLKPEDEPLNETNGPENEMQQKNSNANEN